MRRLLPLALAGVTLLTVLSVLTGCGTERVATVREADTSFSPAPSPSAGPSRTKRPSPTASTASGLHGPLADFPLAIGMSGRNEDDNSPIVVTDQPATRAFSECGHRVWDPHDGTTDVVGVDWSAEAEWSRGRTLVLYASADAAREAVDASGDAITSCPRDDENDYGWTEHTEHDYYAGEQSFGWMDRYWSAEVNGFDTGLTVYHEVRVGRAVLLTYEYMEANGSEASRDEEIARAAKEDQYVVDEMGDLPEDAALTFTPEGVEPLRLGMSPDEIRASAPEVTLHARPGSCTDLSWTGPQGDELRAAYPDLEHADNGLWFADRGASTYAFNLDAPDGRVNDVMVIGDDQRCAS